MRRKRIKLKKKEESKMRDGKVYELLRQLERPVISLQRNEDEISRQIVSLRIQLNAIMRTFKLILPLGWIYSFFYKLEWKIYSRQMKQRQKIMEKYAKKQKEKENKK